MDDDTEMVDVQEECLKILSTILQLLTQIDYHDHDLYIAINNLVQPHLTDPLPSDVLFILKKSIFQIEFIKIQESLCNELIAIYNELKTIEESLDKYVGSQEKEFVIRNTQWLQNAILCF